VKYERNAKFWSSECTAVLAQALPSRDKIQPQVKFWSSECTAVLAQALLSRDKIQPQVKFWSSECTAVLARALLSRDKIQPHVKFWSSECKARKKSFFHTPNVSCCLLQGLKWYYVLGNIVQPFKWSNHEQLISKRGQSGTTRSAEQWRYAQCRP